MSARRRQAEDEDVLRENERLHAELQALVGRNDRERQSNLTFGGSDRHSNADEVVLRRKEITPRSRERVEPQKQVQAPVARPRAEEDFRIREMETQKLRETLDALEYMKKRERALQEEVKSLSQILIK